MNNEINNIARFFDITIDRATVIFNKGWTIEKLKETYGDYEPSFILGLLRLSNNKRQEL